MLDPLLKPVRFLKGVGDKISLLLQKKDIHTVHDALYFFPRTYEDRRKIYGVRDAPIGDEASIFGRVVRSYPVRWSKSKRSGHELLLEDLEHPAAKLVLKWFHKPYALQKIDPGTKVLVTGRVQLFGARKQMTHPEIEVLGKESEESDVKASVVPIYSQTDGLYQKTLRKIEAAAVDTYARHLQEPLPKAILEKYNFPGLAECIKFLHQPKEDVDFQALVGQQTPAHRRFIYEEFFLHSLVLAQVRKDFVDRPGIEFKKPEKSWEILKAKLGFRFTNAQRRSLKEIFDDMNSSRVMYRMLQGDVGSGKTAVSAATALIALESGYQVALMAPTEVLIDQHFRKFTQWFEGTGFPVLRLTGSSSTTARKEILGTLKENAPAIILGTHALFEDRVEFSKLGLVIVDEQHRFGVRQRSRLVAKGENPDLLVMTATPIPRTLALTIYGDLDVSVIDELPPGRKPIETQVFADKQRSHMVERVRAELGKGRQVYIVFPLIEESETLSVKSIESMMPELKKDYEGFEMGVLHGKLKSEEKARVLEAFVQRRISVLVSTTVIEVGVDVPNASVMVIEAAERFGLSQLHQLRGRVGRGSEQSYCYLVNSSWLGQDSMRRLRAMEKIQDGFKLSELDLEWRGAGELAGTKQAGIPEFRLGQVPRDLKIFQEARRDAFELLANDPELSSHQELKCRLDNKLEGMRRS